MPGFDDILVSGSPATITADDIVLRLRKLLEDNPWQDVSTGAYAPADGTIAVASPGNWSEGNTMEADDGTYSQFRVKAPASGNWYTTSPITVTASYNGTSDAIHDSGTVLLKEPRFAGYLLYEAVVRTIISLQSWCWVAKQYTVTPVTSTALYPMPTDFLGLVQGGVVQQGLGTIVEVASYDTILGGVTVVRNLPVTIAPSTVALRFGWFDNFTNAVTVTYRAEITAAAVPDDSIAECVVMGAAARVMGAKEVPYAGQDQGVADPSSAIHAGDQQRTAFWFQSQHIALRYRIRRELQTVAPAAKVYVG